MKTLILLTLILGTLAAEARPPRNQARERRQQSRIREGVRQGDLTREEVKGIRQEQRAIDKAQRDARSDGTVTLEEKKRLEDLQNSASKNIYEQRTDTERRN